MYLWLGLMKIQEQMTVNDRKQSVVMEHFSSIFQLNFFESDTWKTCILPIFCRNENLKHI